MVPKHGKLYSHIICVHASTIAYIIIIIIQNIYLHKCAYKPTKYMHTCVYILAILCGRYVYRRSLTGCAILPPPPVYTYIYIYLIRAYCKLYGYVCVWCVCAKGWRLARVTCEVWGLLGRAVRIYHSILQLSRNRSRKKTRMKRKSPVD